ncbi:MAG TPA: SBBP repeat-containing protein [Candidatus Lokiarchaeia archaeon]|nr:SBBP repeat-containing protein [Candidatus Lokiarchaeia archaeon]
MVQKISNNFIFQNFASEGQTIKNPVSQQENKYLESNFSSSFIRFIAAPNSVKQLNPDIEYVALQGIPGTIIAAFSRTAVTYYPFDAALNETLEIQVIFKGSSAQNFNLINATSGTTNFILGNESSLWSSFKEYSALAYSNLYPGINLTFYPSYAGTSAGLKYEFWVNPGDPLGQLKQIQMEYSILSDYTIVPQDEWNIILGGNGSNITINFRNQTVFSDSNLFSWFENSNSSNEMELKWTKTDFNPQILSLELIPGESSALNTLDTLVIDPFLNYSTFIGGSNDDDMGGSNNVIAIDNSGCAYVTGETASSNFPTTAGANDTSYNGGSHDAFVCKFSPNGTTLLYSTFLGGSGDDSGNGIAVDANGCAYVTGSTKSSNFPTTPGVLKTSFSGGQKGFVTKLSSDGSKLNYSTYLGGSSTDLAGDLIVDATGCAYICGITHSSDFPTTPGAFLTTYSGAYWAGFATKLNQNGSALVNSTLIDGANGVWSIGIDGNASVYVGGVTSQPSTFQTTSGAYNRTYTSAGGSWGDAYICKFNENLSALLYSTYIGGTTTGTGDMVVDSAGCVYFAMGAYSGTFPVTSGAFDPTFNGGTDDGYVCELNSAGSALIYGTFIGGSNDDLIFGLAVDSLGCAYVVGATDSANFPTTPSAFNNTYGGSRDAFLSILSSDGSQLLYSTYIGGSSDNYAWSIALDQFGCAYVAGSTTSINFPVTAGCYDSSYNGGYDVFVFKTNSLFAPSFAGTGLAPNQLCGAAAPSFSLDIVGGNLNATWYSLDGGTTNTTCGLFGTLATQWGSRPNGTVIVTCWANVSVGYINYTNVTIQKDIIPPSFAGTGLAPNQLCGAAAPSFSLNIIGGNLNATWYSLDGGVTNTTCGLFGTLAAQWYPLPNGIVAVTFWANNSVGNVNSTSVTLQKDVIPPSSVISGPTLKITIRSPVANAWIADPPVFTITIEGSNVASVWYSLDAGITNHTLLGEQIIAGNVSGEIDASTWTALPLGQVTIRFYARDAGGNETHADVVVVKVLPAWVYLLICVAVAIPLVLFLRVKVIPANRKRMNASREKGNREKSSEETGGKKLLGKLGKFVKGKLQEKVEEAKGKVTEEAGNQISTLVP